MTRSSMEDDDESSADSERRNPRQKKHISGERTGRSQGSDSEPDSYDHGESRMAIDGTAPGSTGAERKIERDEGEPLRADDGDTPMPSADAIEEQLEEGNTQPMEEEAVEIPLEKEAVQIPPDEDAVQFTLEEQEVNFPLDGEEGNFSLDNGEQDIAPEEEEGSPSEMERDDEGGPLLPSAADEGKEKAKDKVEKDVVENSSSGAKISYRESGVSDEQLEELQTYLKSRWTSRSERQIGVNKDVKIEDLVEELSIYMLGSSKTAILPAKPAIGEYEVLASKCSQDVVANHYVIHKLEQRESLELFRVSWPDTLWKSSNGGKKRREYWKEIFRDDLQLWRDHFGLRMYDGGNFLVLNLLPNGRPKCLSKVVTKFKIPNDGPDILGELTVIYLGPVNMNDFKYLRNREESAAFPQTYVDAVNFIMKQYCRDLDYLEVGRFFFDRNASEDIGEAIIKRLGYFQSVRLLEVGLTLNVDVCGTAFYKPKKSVAQIWEGLVMPSSRQSQKMLPISKVDLFSRQTLDSVERLSSEQLHTVNDYLRNLKVEMLVLDARPRLETRLYTIDEVTNTRATEQTIIEIGTGRKMNLIEFMRRQYGWPREQMYNNLPAIKLQRPKKTKSGAAPDDLYLPWGACFTSEKSRVTGVMPPLIKKMQEQVSQRYKNISDWMNKRYENSSYPAAEEHFKLRPDTDMLVVMPLALKRPKLELGESNDQPWDSTGPKLQGHHSYYGPEKRFANPATIRTWSVISFDHPMKRDQEETFIDELLTAAEKKGMIWHGDTRFPGLRPSRNIIRYFPRTEWPRYKLLRDLKELTEAAEEEYLQPLEFILCFMSDKMPMEYGLLKHHLERKAGVPSQVILSRHLKMKYNGLDNLLLKINAKCGGTNFRIAQVQDLSLLQNTILMGLDVTHPRYGAKDTKFSIAALVATTDQSGVEYACRLKAQPAGQEMTDSESMKVMVTELLKVYRRNVGKYPERIILFRDGLSESQVFANLRFEGTAILRAARALKHLDNRAYEPKLAIILSIKRHHTRFFVVRPGPSDPKETAAKRPRTGSSTRQGSSPRQGRGNLDNPARNYVADNIQAGTVVYDTVTHPVEFDFYLCSQESRMGTCRPTRYHVVLDQIALGQVELYQTINTLCHTFQRSPKSVSLVAPVSYAHLAAARASLYLDQEAEYARELRILQYKKLNLNVHAKLKNRLWFL